MSDMIFRWQEVEVDLHLREVVEQVHVVVRLRRSGRHKTLEASLGFGVLLPRHRHLLLGSAAELTVCVVGALQDPNEVVHAVVQLGHLLPDCRLRLEVLGPSTPNRTAPTATLALLPIGDDECPVAWRPPVRPAVAAVHHVART